MGASRTIARAYKCALALGICIQLLLFFYTASVTIFLDQMNKNLVGSNPEHKTVLLVGYSISIVCVAPWLYTVSSFNTAYIDRSHICLLQAWYGIRRENKKMMYIFFILSILYLGVSGAMFTVSNVRSRATPIVLTPSCHTVDYLQADLRVLDMARYFIRNFVGSTRGDCRSCRLLHPQLREGVAPLL